jgi:hypothetical protein
VVDEIEDNAEINARNILDPHIEEWKWRLGDATYLPLDIPTFQDALENLQ